MDGNKKADFAGTPAQYVAAWQHIVTIFRQEGADNVGWVWCPNASAFNDGEAQEFYPGDNFVDWTCADGYNWAPGRAGDDYRSFEDIFGAFYAWASLHDKPIMVGEFGVQERGPGEKAQWIAAAGEAMKTDLPLLRAIVYFNANKDYDWRLITSDSALEAFKRLANDPWFNLGVNRGFRSSLRAGARQLPFLEGIWSHEVDAWIAAGMGWLNALIVLLYGPALLDRARGRHT